MIEIIEDELGMKHIRADGKDLGVIHGHRLLDHNQKFAVIYSVETSIPMLVEYYLSFHLALMALLSEHKVLVYK